MARTHNFCLNKQSARAQPSGEIFFWQRIGIPNEIYVIQTEISIDTDV
jgi:hypothetical protein